MNQNACLDCHEVTSPPDRSTRNAVLVISLSVFVIAMFAMSPAAGLAVSTIATIMFFMIFAKGKTKCGKCQSIRLVPADSIKGREIMAR